MSNQDKKAVPEVEALEQLRSLMTMVEKITALEKKVAELERQLAGQPEYWPPTHSFGDNVHGTIKDSGECGPKPS